MARFSFSRVGLFENCPYRYKLKYIDKWYVMEDVNPNNALVVGNLLHHAIEVGLDKAEKEYYNSFNVINDSHVNEVIKVEQALKLVDLPRGGTYEKPIRTDNFIGYMDYLVEIEPGVYDLYDFKYSNNVDSYKKSPQLSIYKYHFEQQTGQKIRNMYYYMIPKQWIRQKKSETLYEFRQRIKKSAKPPVVVEHKYDPNEVVKFYASIKEILESQIFPKNPSRLCDWCEYQKYCEEGRMLLPKNERRTIQDVENRRIWVYGGPFSGKTTFANQFPNPLMLNTDGNIKFVDAPYISIQDEVKMNGRVKETKLAWQLLKDVIDELEKKENDFETIVVDLLEDMYTYCRFYIFEELGISHESDASFKAWDMVRTEFANVIYRLTHLDYKNIVLISHEDTTKDITKRSGDNITQIKPNIQDKVATKVSGLVDCVGRVVVVDGEHYLDFATDEVVFGGGRLSDSMNTRIDLNYENFAEKFDNAVKQARVDDEKSKETKQEEPKKEERKVRE